MRRKKEQDFLVKSNICNIIESTEKDRHFLLSELARQSNEVDQLQNGKIFTVDVDKVEGYWNTSDPKMPKYDDVHRPARCSFVQTYRYSVGAKICIKIC